MNKVRVEYYPLVLKHNGFLDASSFTFHVYIPAARLGGHLDDCDCIGASIAIEHPFIEPTKCGVRIVFSQDVEGFAQAIFPDGVQSYPRPGSSISKCQVDMVESSMSKGQNDSNIMQEKSSSVCFQHCIRFPVIFPKHHISVSHFISLTELKFM